MEQQQQKNNCFVLFSRQMEYSKKLAFLDTVIYVALTVAAIILSIFNPAFLGILPNLITIFSTSLVTLRLGYTAKSGIENYKKIQASMRGETREEEENG